jgi:hypothetical protein
LKVTYLRAGHGTGKISMSAKIYTDKYTGKQYRVLDGYSAKVVQYAAA